MDFLERFRGKISKIGKHGNIGLECSKPIAVKRSFNGAEESFQLNESSMAVQKPVFNYPESDASSFPIDTTLLSQLEKEESKSPVVGNRRGVSASRKYQYMNYFAGNSFEKHPAKPMKGEVPTQSSNSFASKAAPLCGKETTPRPCVKVAQAMNAESGSSEAVPLQFANPSFSKEMHALIGARKPPIQRRRILIRGSEAVEELRKEKEGKLKVLTGSELAYAVPGVTRTNKSASVISAAKSADAKNSRVLKNAAYHYLASSKPSSNPNTHRNEDGGQNTSESFSSMVSAVSAPNSIKYRPYGLKDYREMKPKSYYTLGGLGANVGGKDWEERTERARRICEYSRNVQQLNKSLKTTARHPRHHPEYEAAAEIRKKMLSYAKNVPRPKLPRIAEVDEGLSDTGNPFLQQLGQMHNLIYS